MLSITVLPGGLCRSDGRWHCPSRPVRITCTGDGGTHTAEVSPDSGGLFLWCAPERLPTYTLYTAQALDGQGQVLYTVERTMVDEHDII